MFKKKRKIVFPLVKSTTKFITRYKGLLSLSTPLTVFQWTFHNSGHLDFTVSSLNCGISLLVENPEERPCWSHLPHCLISLKGSGMGGGGEPSGVGNSCVAGFSPQVCLVHRSWPTSSTSPPLSAEARKTWTSKKQQWLSYLFSVFAEPPPQHNQEGLSWKAGMQIKQRLQICTYVSRYKRRIISNNLCKKKKKCQDIFLWKRKRKRNGGWGDSKSSWGFFNSKIYRGAKVMFTR